MGKETTKSALRLTVEDFKETRNGFTCLCDDGSEYLDLSVSHREVMQELGCDRGLVPTVWSAGQNKESTTWMPYFDWLKRKPACLIDALTSIINEREGRTISRPSNSFQSLSLSQKAA